METNIKERLTGKKILFATVPADGHFNPLTGLAKHLQQLGCDVRWFTSDIFADKLKKLGIPHYGYEKTLNVNGDNVDEHNGRKQITDPIEKLNFDFIHFFIERSPECYADILKIHETFPFDMMIADSTFTAIPLVRFKMNKPVLSIGIIPLVEDSTDLAPFGMALPPATDEATRNEYAVLHDHALNVLFKQSIDIHANILNEFGIEFERSMFTNLLVKQSSLYLQIGSPAFDYERSVGDNVRFIGALLPHQADAKGKDHQCWFDERVNQYQKIVLVTQGTVEKDTSKLTEPALEAFKNSDVLVIATTAGSNTKELREKYNYNNIIIEDYIPFNDVMPYAHVYITNGGYGGSLLSINNQLPMVAAGVHEGKSEICARIGYLKYGVNLNTETPTPEAIREATEEVMNNELYKNNIIKLYNEMSGYNSKELCTQYIAELLTNVAEAEPVQADLTVN